MAEEPNEITGDEELGGLLRALAEVPDPRDPRGVRYPLSATLGLCVLAFICGRSSLSGVSRFGRDHKKLLKPLGFPNSRSPSVPTLSRVLGRIEAKDLQRALAGWIGSIVRRAGKPGLGSVASVDGKAARAAGAHVLNVFVHDLQMVVWAASVDKKANEITTFKAALKDLLEKYPFLELVIGDAMFAGRPLCELLIENGRHYLFQIKADQPDLLEKMGLVFSPSLSAKPDPGRAGGEKKKGLRRRPRSVGG